ncbi:MAG: hypothetical protein NZ654_06485 [Acidimicrobiales bacterium]|jgi:hypothetical protein|nr:hypothetical protein [Acidimicrobiales bacterium]
MFPAPLRSSAGGTLVLIAPLVTVRRQARSVDGVEINGYRIEPGVDLTRADLIG